MAALDLGIGGRTALVCGSSKGLGKACASALALAGVHVILNGRDETALRLAVEEISDIAGRKLSGVAADITTEAGRMKALQAPGALDILINNAGGPPPGNFEDWDEAIWLAAVTANMVAPIQLIRSTIGAMRRQGWGRIINITSAAVKAPLPLLGLSNGARSGLTGFIAGLAREVAADGVTVNNMLPGHFATGRLETYVSSLAASRNIPASTILAELSAANPTGRIGKPAEFGATCAFLCSIHAGFITGQNLLLDGGTYPGVL